MRLASCLGALAAPVRARWQCREPNGLVVSGAAWSAALDRYVLLGDTADERDSARLFALTAGGQLDPIPLRLPADIGTIRAVTPGPSGSLFVLTTPRSVDSSSQSSRLVQLALASGRIARVIGSLELDAALLGEAATPPVAESRITGLAYQNDVLYLALEAKIRPGTGPTILALPHATTVLASGAIAKAVWSVWSAAPFCRSSGTCERISDLAADGTGGLLVTTHAASAGFTSVGETLWQLSRPGAAPRELERFEGLGRARLALSSDQSSAILLFDGADRQPLWLTWRLPS